MSRALGALLRILIATATMVASRPALADAMDDCIEDSERAQVLRQRGRIVESAALFERCASDVCPALVRADCIKGVEEARASTPTVVLSATDDAGVDVLDARVSVDGALVLERPNGQETALDPGTHFIVFERANGARVSMTVLVKAGEKRRPVVARFPARLAPRRPHDGAGGTTTEERPSLAVPVVLIGLSAVSVAGAAYLQVSGTADVDDTRERCGGACPREEVDALEDRISTREWGARGALAVAALTAGAAIYLIVTRSSRSGSARMRDAMGLKVRF